MKANRNAPLRGTADTAGQESVPPANYGLRILEGAAVVLLLLFVSLHPSAKERANARKIYSISFSSMDRLRLCDVHGDDLLLLAEGSKDRSHFLILYNVKDHRIVHRIPIDPLAYSFRPFGYPRRFGEAMEFKFSDSGNRIIGLLPPWLVLYDTVQQKEIRRRLLSHSLITEIPKAFGPWPSGPPTAGVMDVNRQGANVAAAFNLGAEPSICTVARNLEGRADCRKAHRFVQDIRWSPDGERLAVLYSNEFNTRNEYVWNAKFRAPPLPPNVEIFSPVSGKDVRFRTGSMAAKIEFSRDGREIYSIGIWAYIDQRDVIRVFLSKTGALMRTITVPHTGVRGSFALSPDGRVLVADASTNVPHSFLTEGTWGEKIGRFVLLDPQTGRLTFEHHKRIPGEISDPAQFAFSDDGKYLFVAPNSGRFATPDTPDRVDVFSLNQP